MPGLMDSIRPDSPMRNHRDITIHKAKGKRAEKSVPGWGPDELIRRCWWDAEPRAAVAS
jgi:hypothetical protein